MLSTEENDVVMASKQQQQKRRAVFGDITNVSWTVFSSKAAFCLFMLIVSCIDVFSCSVPGTVNGVGLPDSKGI